MTRILIDLDDTIADWSGRFDKGLDGRFGSDGIRRSTDQTGFDLFEGHSSEQKRIIREVMSEPSFYAELEPIPGAIEAIKEMVAEGHDVFIVTSPWVSNPTCASDKLAWVEKNLGTNWGRRTIITADKTVIRGDVLFDDKGNITGADDPNWVQVLIDQPHNRGQQLGRIRQLSWSSWQTSINAALLVQAGRTNERIAA